MRDNYNNNKNVLWQHYGITDGISIMYPNNISVILWPSVLLEEETGVPGEITIDLSQVTDKLSHNVVSSTPRLSGV
jgi:hypothetical protein